MSNGHVQGAERSVKVPKELLRFQDLPMQVSTSLFTYACTLWSPHLQD